MQTRSVVQASANVIRITNVQKGNIYKRFDSNDYTYYGVVTGVHNDGVHTIIEATEYRKSWREMQASHKIIKGTEDVAIFPATLDEIKAEFASVVDEKKREIETKLKEIETAKDIIALTEKLISGELSKELSTVGFSEMSQPEFDEKVKALNP